MILYKNKNINILDIANSDLINALSNIAQFYNIYQSTKAGTYAQLNHDLDLQTSVIESQLDIQTNNILQNTFKAINELKKQNEIIISQNDKIINLLNKIGDYFDNK